MASINLTIFLAENEEEKKGPSADLLQATIGDYGFWQYKIAILMSLLRLPVNWFELGIVFLAPPTQFWCNFPPHEGNSTDDEFYSNVSIFLCLSECETFYI